MALTRRPARAPARPAAARVTPSRRAQDSATSVSAAPSTASSSGSTCRVITLDPVVPVPGQALNITVTGTDMQPLVSVIASLARVTGDGTKTNVSSGRTTGNGVLETVFPSDFDPNAEYLFSVSVTDEDGNEVLMGETGMTRDLAQVIADSAGAAGLPSVSVIATLGLLGLVALALAGRHKND